MARVLTVWAVLGFGVSLALGETVIMEINPYRDNFNVNYPGKTNYNCGATENYCFSKVKQEGTYYCDWTYDDLEALGAAIAAGPSTPGNWLEVYFVIYGTSGADPAKVARLETLDSVTDWTEGNDSRGPSTGGACDDAAATSPHTPWVDTASQQPVSFWGLTPAFQNTATTSGWLVGPAAENANLVLLDPPLVQHVITSPYNRGLRAFQDNWDGTENAWCAAIGKWAALSGGKLRLVEVPEPATMLLLGAGGLGVLLRKNR